MRFFFVWVLKAFGILLSVIVTFTAAGGLIYWSWQGAPRDGSRFRWAIVARETIPAGEQITARMIGGQLRRLSIRQDQVAIEGDVLGQYSYRHIPGGAVIERSAVGPALWTKTDSSTAIVPVAVESEFVAGLHPGMRVSFARAVDNKRETAGIPNCSETPLPSPGYLLVSKIQGSGDSPKAVLVVQVPRQQAGTIADLSNGTWRVIGLGSEQSVSDICLE